MIARFVLALLATIALTILIVMATRRLVLDDPAEAPPAGREER